MVKFKDIHFYDIKVYRSLIIVSIGIYWMNSTV